MTPSLRKFTFGVALVSLVSLAAAQPASAAQIISFGQTSGLNTVTGTANGAGTATTISGTDIAVSITQIENVVTPPDLPAFLTFTMTSNDAYTGVLQHYDGTFSVYSGAGLTGTNYLSGTFTNGVYVAPATASGGIFSANQPPNGLVFTENGPITDIGTPVAFSLSFTNVVPPNTLVGTTLGSFTSSVTGNASAFTPETAVPEPGSMMLLGTGLLGFAASARRRLRRRA